MKSVAKKMSELKTEELTAELKLTKDIEDYLDFDELASVSLAEYIQNTFACRVEVVAFAESSSQKLLEVADDFFNLSSDKRKFLI